MTTFIDIISAISAFAAAILWVYSAKVRVKFDESIPGKDGDIAIIDDDNSDLLKSLRAQSEWSVKAAYMAALAATFQGIGLLLKLRG